MCTVLGTAHASGPALGNCAHPLYLEDSEQLQPAVALHVARLERSQGAACPAVDSLQDLAHRTGGGLLQLVFVIDHLLDRGELLRPVARLADVELPQLVPGFAHLAGGELLRLVLEKLLVARPADGELFQLVFAIVHLLESGELRRPVARLADVELPRLVLGFAHLAGGELLRPVARLADVELPQLVPGFAHLAGGELLRLVAHLDRPARTSCSPVA